MDLRNKIERLSDEEVEKCLQVVLKGFTGRHPEYGRLVSSPAETKAAVDSLIQQLQLSTPNFESDQRTSVKRQALALVAQDPSTAPWVEAWVGGDRPTLLEPITTAIVLASIVMLLSANVAIDVEKKNGKTSLKVHVDKKPTATSILKKFFKIF